MALSMTEYLIDGNEPEDMAQLVVDLMKRLDAYGETNIKSLKAEMDEFEQYLKEEA